MGTELRLEFADSDGMEAEFETNLRFGRALLLADAEDEVEVLSDCTLIIAHPGGAELSLGAQVVMAAGGMVGVELRPFDDELAGRIRAFIDSDGAPAPEADDATGEDDDDSDHSPDVQFETRQQQLRAMSMNQVQKLARTGELSDRVSLERLYGKSVWEPLLHNPKLTVPEVAKIARKGTVPRPLLTFIVDNGAWARQSPVRRALLGNPRVGRDDVQKLLFMTPRHELKLIVKGTSYPMPIRDAAKRILGD